MKLFILFFYKMKFLIFIFSGYYFFIWIDNVIIVWVMVWFYIEIFRVKFIVEVIDKYVIK